MEDEIAEFCRAEEAQLKGVVPERLWRTAAQKILGQVFDLGSAYAFAGRKLVAKSDISAEGDIWLVDHMFTFGTMADVQAGLAANDEVRRRVAAIGGLSPDSSVADVVDNVVWQFARPLPKRCVKQQTFFVEDEFGCSFESSYEEGGATVNAAPIQCGGWTHTLIWPNTPCAAGEAPKRRLIERIGPFADTIRTAHRAVHANDQSFSSWALSKWRLARDAHSAQLDAWHESAAVNMVAQESYVAPPLAAPVTVSTDKAWVRRHVTDTRFQFVGREAAASAEAVCWSSGGVGFAGNVNQIRSWYDYEAALIRKDHLSQTLNRAGLRELAPDTYDLETALEPVLAEITDRPSAHWILKPANLGRSIGVVVTKSKACVLAYAIAGGYIAQRYVERPLLLPESQRKFDIRIVILLRSAKPLELYAHNVVFIRAANKAHDLDRLDDTEVALTAMHLIGKRPNHPHIDDFVRTFQGGPSVWRKVLAACHSAIARVFVAAAEQHSGFADSSRYSRAMYGCDFILEESQEHECGCRPKLLEITFDPADLAMSDNMPEQYPDFANECFGCLYLGDLVNVTRLQPHHLEERVTATDLTGC